MSFSKAVEWTSMEVREPAWKRPLSTVRAGRHLIKAGGKVVAAVTGKSEWTKRISYR